MVILRRGRTPTQPPEPKPGVPMMRRIWVRGDRSKGRAEGTLHWYLTAPSAEVACNLMAQRTRKPAAYYEAE